MDYDKQLITVAQNALLEGAVHVKNLFGKSIEEIGLEYKVKDGDTPRTLIDTNAENAILSAIKNSAYKDDMINAEESGTSGASGKRTWYIDPYDGTSNAQIRLGMSTMGIGIMQDKKVIAGVVLNPFEMEMLYAADGQGAYKVGLAIENGKFIISSDPKPLVPAITKSAKERYVWVDALGNDHTKYRKTAWLCDMTDLAQNWRMTGSNIDYSSKLASGRGDIQLTDAVGGFFDLAPGIVLMRELGGYFVDLDGNEPQPGCHVAVAGVDPALKNKVLEITNKHYGTNGPLGLYAGFRGAAKK